MLSYDAISATAMLQHVCCSSPTILQTNKSFGLALCPQRKYGRVFAHGIENPVERPQVIRLQIRKGTDVAMILSSLICPMNAVFSTFVCFLSSGAQMIIGTAES